MVLCHVRELRSRNISISLKITFPSLKQRFLIPVGLFLVFTSPRLFLKPFSAPSGLPFFGVLYPGPFAPCLEWQTKSGSEGFLTAMPLFPTRERRAIVWIKREVSVAGKNLLILWLQKEKDNLIEKVFPGKEGITLSHVKFYSRLCHKSFSGSLIWPWGIPKQLEGQRAVFTGECTKACLMPLTGYWGKKIIFSFKMQWLSIIQ